MQEIQEMWVWSVDQEDPLEKEIATHSSILLGNSMDGGVCRATYSLKSKSESFSVLSDSLWSHGLYIPWNSPGLNTGVGSLSLLQGLFPTQESKPGLPHCRSILYQLSYDLAKARSNALAQQLAGKDTRWVSCLSKCACSSDPGYPWWSTHILRHSLVGHPLCTPPHRALWEVGFPGDSDGKESVCNVGDPDLIPGSGRSPGEGHGNPLQYSCLENPTDRGAWRATVRGVAKSRTRLSD